MQNIYCLSGLGADEKIFRKLNIPGAKLIDVPWIREDSRDTMETYAQRLLQTIPDGNPILLGLSFGGMLATEIAKLIPVKKVFLVSSAKTQQELPPLLSANKWLAELNLIPAFAYNMPNPLIYYYCGAHTEEEKELIATMLRNTSSSFIRWAILAMGKWQNTTISEKIISIHGTSDILIPAHCVKADHWIKHGTHIMLYNRADEISAIIANELAQS